MLPEVRWNWPRPRTEQTEGAEAVSKKKVKVDLRLPLGTIAALDAIAKRGILGDTRQDVMLHMVREYLFMQDLARGRLEKKTKEPPC